MRKLFTPLLLLLLAGSASGQSYTYSVPRRQATVPTTDAWNYTVCNALSDLPANSGNAGDLAYVLGTAQTYVWSGAAWMQTSQTTNSVFVTFGDGSDGDVSLDGTVAAPTWAAKSGSVYTINRDVYLRNLTLTGTAQVRTTGWRLCVNNILDITVAAAGAITASGTVGNAAAGSVGGTANSAQTAITAGTGGTNTAGTAGATAAGTQATAVTALATANGGGTLTGGSGAGGTGSGGAGGAGRVGVNATNTLAIHYVTHELNRGVTQLQGGQGGAGGGGGGGDATAAGGGGAGGSGGNVLALYVRFIKRGASTPAGCITVVGGAGGAGAAAVAGNRGGGGGGAGGGGGWIYLVYEGLLGTAATGALVASGGVGGAGAAGFGTGTAGGGGNGGGGGRLTLFNFISGTSVESIGGNGSAASGSTGGAGGVLVAAL